MSLFFGINTALKGMMAQQTALNVTSNNIANANTDGYSRQRADLVESYSISGLVPGAQLGSGVDIADVSRIRDGFVDYQLRTQTSSLEYDTIIHDTLSNVETVFNESSSDTGLSSLLDNFWSAWQNVSVTPDSSAVRTTLMESAVSLTDSIRQISSQLTQIQSDTQTQIDQSVKDVNSISQRIKHLNDQIVASKSRGETPNDLLDARDLLLDQLSEIGNITVTNCQDADNNFTGAVKVIFGTNTDTTTKTNNETSTETITETSTIVDGSSTYDISCDDIKNYKVTDGSLGALVKLKGTDNTADTVQYYIDKLNTFAVSIAKNVNEIHTMGKDLKNNFGKDFFVFKDSEGNPITVSDWENPPRQFDRC